MPEAANLMRTSPARGSSRSSSVTSHGRPGARMTAALVLDPVTGKCSERLLGLVGLHIVMKTKQLPQWMWATFEQVDNAPDQAALPTPPGKTYNFYGNCPNCPVNTPPATGSTTPTQVVRVTPVSSDAASDNTIFTAALVSLRGDNVWQNYMLVDAQWGANSTLPPTPNQPNFLANTTLETYLQTPTPPHGCINCHAFAVATDLDFQLTHAYPRNNKVIRELLKVPGVAHTR